jgi:hypothetical protein
LFCLFFWVFIGLQKASAQTINNHGYVVTNRFDTIHGNVYDRREGLFPRLYKRIRLKTGGLFNKRFNPREIRAYKKGNETFESIYISSRKGILQQEILSIQGKGSKRFVKVVHKGFLSLYHLEFIDYDSGFFDYVPYFHKKDQAIFIRVTQGLLGLRKNTLSNYLSDCEELVRLINDGSIKSPIKIAEFYNDCQK